MQAQRARGEQVLFARLPAADSELPCRRRGRGVKSIGTSRGRVAAALACASRGRPPRPADTWTSPIACGGRRRADSLRASQWKVYFARQASRATSNRAPHAALSGLRLDRTVCVYGSSLASARGRFSAIQDSAVAHQRSSTARTATQAAPCLALSVCIGSPLSVPSHPPARRRPPTLVLSLKRGGQQVASPLHGSLPPQQAHLALNCGDRAARPAGLLAS
jgi:hypothetical protein